MASLNKKINNPLSDKQEVVSITYEEIGLFPRSFSRVFDRFLKQVFSDVENLVIQEYRFYRYLFLTTLKCLLILVFIPLFVNFVAKTYIVRPLTEYFWNTKQTEIFLNSYQQKHAFAELKDFEEKIYFESLIYPKSASLFMPSLIAPSQTSEADSDLNKNFAESESFQKPATAFNEKERIPSFFTSPPISLPFREEKDDQKPSPSAQTAVSSAPSVQTTPTPSAPPQPAPKAKDYQKKTSFASAFSGFATAFAGGEGAETPLESPKEIQRTTLWTQNPTGFEAVGVDPRTARSAPSATKMLRSVARISKEDSEVAPSAQQRDGEKGKLIEETTTLSFLPTAKKAGLGVAQGQDSLGLDQRSKQSATPLMLNSNLTRGSVEEGKEVNYFPLNFEENAESFLNSYTLKSSLFVYQTQEADKNIQQRYQEKTIELAQRYNDQSIEAITNFLADLISLISLFYLLYALEIQINITKSFLLEVFFGLDDSKKSLLILLITDLLVGYHSSNLWELFFEFLFHHYGLPESQTGIFLLVATLPVLLDVLFKYLIFRHLNRSSPATVATYHAMIE